MKGATRSKHLLEWKSVGSKIKLQKGFAANSIVVCPNIYAYDDLVTCHELLENFNENYDLYAYAKFNQVPTRTKKRWMAIEYCMIRQRK